jgi:hypothetical protein
MHVIMGPLGEKSAEIDAVADVRPDPFGDCDEDDDIDLVDVSALQRCMGLQRGVVPACAKLSLPVPGAISDLEVARFVSRMTGPQ